MQKIITPSCNVFFSQRSSDTSVSDSFSSNLIIWKTFKNQSNIINKTVPTCRLLDMVLKKNDLINNTKRASRKVGFEPTTTVLKTVILPLNYSL